MLIKTKGSIPNTFMDAFNDNQRLASENDQLKKMVSDKDQEETKKPSAKKGGFFSFFKK